jgi:hypothetical protein
MHPSAPFLVAILLANLALSGCVATPPATVADAAPPATPSPSQLQARESPEGALLDGPSRTPYRLDGCSNFRYMFSLLPAAAQELLPEGFTPEDATVVMEALQISRPQALRAGMAVGGYDTVQCEADSLSQGPLAFSDAFVFVEAPRFEGARASDLHLYNFVSYLSHPLWLEIYGSGRGPGVPGKTQTGPSLTPSSFNAAVIADQKEILDVSVQFGPQPWTGIEANFTATGWTVTERGTMRFEIVESQHREYLGPLLSCTHGPGTFFERVSGGRGCDKVQGIVAAGLGQDGMTGEIIWEPDRFPEGA